MFAKLSNQPLQVTSQAVQTQHQTRKDSLSERIGKRVSWELAKLAIGAWIVIAVMNATYDAWMKIKLVINSGWANVASSFEPGARAKSVELIEPALGISFAPDYATATPMESYEPEHLDALVDHYAAIYEVDAGTLRGIITQESSWNPNAVNDGALGLGQLRPSTRRKLGITEEEAHDPKVAIRATASWLAIKKKEQGGDEAEAVQSYFCGPSDAVCVNKPKGIDYLKQVVKKYDTPPPAPKGLNAKRVG